MFSSQHSALPYEWLRPTNTTTCTDNSTNTTNGTRLHAIALTRGGLEDVVHAQDHLSSLVGRHKHLLLDPEGLSDAKGGHVSDLNKSRVRYEWLELKKL